MSYTVTAEWGYAHPDKTKTKWWPEIKADPIEIGKVSDVEEFHRMVEINMGDAKVLVHLSDPDSESYIYRDEFGGNDPTYWWVKYKRVEQEND